MNRSNQSHEEMIERIKEVRAQAIEHTRQARRFAVERRDFHRIGEPSRRERIEGSSCPTDGDCAQEGAEPG